MYERNNCTLKDVFFIIVCALSLHRRRRPIKVRDMHTAGGAVGAAVSTHTAPTGRALAVTVTHSVINAKRDLSAVAIEYALKAKIL